MLPDASLTSLVTVPRKVSAKPGTNGSGEWRNGRRGKDRVVRVPMGTVVRVVGWGGGGRRGAGEWVHYPGWGEANVGREEFKEAEKWMEREERRREWEGKKKWGVWVDEGREVDLDEEGVEVVVGGDNEPLGKKRKEWLGYLIAGGGAGGLGNPHFSGTGETAGRAPKFGTRGVDGEQLTVCLELKTNADVALVGKCSVGKSTLIRALTGGRVKSDVGEWDGVTRGVVRGVVRIAHREGEGRVWEGELGGRGKDEEDEFSTVPTRAGYGFDLYESFRFMVTDNPGFVDEDEAPITQTILRSIERAKVLVYVVDLSGDAPWDELRDVMREARRGTGAGKALVVANKADMLVGEDGSEEDVRGARAKLRRLEVSAPCEVVPVSAMWRLNLGTVVLSLEALLKADS